MSDTELHRWEFWQGISGLWYARRKMSSPPVVLKAESSTAIAERVLIYLSCPTAELRWAMVRLDSGHDEAFLRKRRA